MRDPDFRGQLELGILRQRENDRNYDRGGRSFYFFDFDDNIAFLSTQILIFHRDDGREVALSSAEWAQHHSVIGRSGPYVDFEIRPEEGGSFRFFRDLEARELERLGRKSQIFVEDVAGVLGFPDLQWKGPSWECFYHATFNQRPVSVITARGHHPDTIKDGIRMFVNKKILPLEPNYLTIFPVSHLAVRETLGDLDLSLSVAELKQRAIRRSVEQAIEVYGYSAHHRFGMSDDDPKNIQLIAEEMTRLKATYPEMSFFLIETHAGNFVKHEVGLSGLSGTRLESLQQLSLFGKT